MNPPNLISSIRAARCLLIAGVLSFLFVSTAGGAILSTFDSDDEGWRAVGDSASSDPDWLSSGGNPGGYVEVEDSVVGGVWYWSAPSKFLGDRSSFLGNTLSFDLQQSSTNNQFSAVDVYLKNNTDVVALKINDHPGTDWTSYAVTLHPSAGWQQDDGNGAPATLSDFQTVLGNLTALEIRGEYVTGSDTGGLDNVMLVPEPGTSAALAGVLGLGLALARRRR
ncbi:MAG: laminin B domain-containing protein [Opitutales bacterium]